MITTFFRTLIIYFFLIVSVRLMGKRQIGELQPSELVTTLLLSELAAQPVADSNIPLLSALVPIAVLLTVEVMLSYAVSRNRIFKRLFCGVPSVLLYNGEIREKELRRARISPEELLAELRQHGISSPKDASYAVLEANGKLSVFESAAQRPPSAEDLGVKTQESGVIHPLVVDGTFCKNNLTHLSFSKEDVEKMLRRSGIHALDDVFLFGVNDVGEVFLAKAERAMTPAEKGRAAGNGKNKK